MKGGLEQRVNMGGELNGRLGGRCANGGGFGSYIDHFGLVGGIEMA